MLPLKFLCHRVIVFQECMLLGSTVLKLNRQVQRDVPENEGQENQRYDGFYNFILFPGN